MAQNPKKTLTSLRLKHSHFGPIQRIDNALDAFESNLVFPKPVEYDDIDKAVLDFVSENIPMMADGKKAPTFTLFSNQRFSEYSQTWQHTDEEGNLLMDFKTVNRIPNPVWGTNQSGLYNIPGDRRYTVQMKEVMDDNGTESYEVYSMPQPLCVDMEYTVNYVTAEWSKLNDFNLCLIELFKSMQCYIKPNGWYMPMKLSSIDDQTEYAVDNRKIYIQSASVLVQGIVVPRSSYKIETFPKRTFLSSNEDSHAGKATVDVFETENGSEMSVYFPEGVGKAEFTFDDNSIVKEIVTDNIRDFSIIIGGERVTNARDGFVLNDTDTVKVKIHQIDKSFPSKLTFTL